MGSGPRDARRRVFCSENFFSDSNYFLKHLFLKVKLRLSGCNGFPIKNNP
jgi:hypothetical protein